MCLPFMKTMWACLIFPFWARGPLKVFPLLFSSNSCWADPFGLFFFALPFLMEPVKAYFLLSWRGSSHRGWPFPTTHGPLYSIPYFFYGYSFSLGLRDMVLLFLPLFLSLFFLSPGLIWAFLPLGPCYQKWELTLCIPLYNIIVLHTCILPFLMISLANDEIL